MRPIASEVEQPLFHEVGPLFEATARTWTAHLADADTVGGHAAHVGPTTVGLADGTEREIDVVAAGDGAAPSERRVLCLGEAKAGEPLSERHLHRLEEARTALGGRATDARLLLFGVDFTPQLVAAAGRRGDVELIDLERLYGVRPRPASHR